MTTLFFTLFIVLFFSLFFYCDFKAQNERILKTKKAYQVVSFINLMLALFMLALFALYSI